MITPMDLIFPPRCTLCGKILSSKADLCPECMENAPFFKNSKRKLQFLDSFTAVWYYKEYVRASLIRFKFHRGLYLAAPYGRFLAAKIRQVYPEGMDYITWVPTSPIRMLKRGYDQSHLIARAVGRELGVRPRRLLFKIRHNPAQSGLSDAALRRGNVVGAYRVLAPGSVRGKRILLIDDILTTGATAGECARMLKTAGAAQVHCAAVAATPKE